MINLIQDFLSEVINKELAKDLIDALAFLGKIKNEIFNSECEELSIEDILCYYNLDFKYVDLFTE